MSLAKFWYIGRILYPEIRNFFPENLPGTVCYLGSGTDTGKKISVFEMSLFNWCVMFLLPCATNSVHNSTCVVSFRALLCVLAFYCSLCCALKQIICPMFLVNEFLPSFVL